MLLLAGCASAQPSPALTLDTSGIVYPERDLDRPVSPIDIPTPQYPPELQGVGGGGRVRLEYIVGPDGRVEAASIKVVSATHPGFGEQAVKAIRDGFFHAGVKNGRYVRAKVSQLITFVVGN